MKLGFLAAVRCLLPHSLLLQHGATLSRLENGCALSLNSRITDTLEYDTASTVPHRPASAFWLIIIIILITITLPIRVF